MKKKWKIARTSYADSNLYTLVCLIWSKVKEKAHVRIIYLVKLNSNINIPKKFKLAKLIINTMELRVFQFMAALIPTVYSMVVSLV